MPTPPGRTLQAGGRGRQFALDVAQLSPQLGDLVRALVLRELLQVPLQIGLALPQVHGQLVLQLVALLLRLSHAEPSTPHPACVSNGPGRGSGFGPRTGRHKGNTGDLKPGPAS